MRKIFLVFIMCAFSVGLLAQTGKSRLSVQSSFFSESFLEGGSNVTMFINNGFHVGLEYPFFSWFSSPKKEGVNFGSQEGFLRLNTIFYQLPSLSNNSILNGELGIRKTFYFGLFIESSFSVGSMNYSYIFPVFQVDEGNQINEIHNYNYWESFTAYSFSLGWDFEKNMKLPLSIYLRTLSHYRGGYVEYYKNSLVAGINFRFNKPVLPAVILNKTNNGGNDE